MIGKVRSKQLIQAVLGRGRKSEFSEDLEKDVKVKAGLADKWGGSSEVVRGRRSFGRLRESGEGGGRRAWGWVEVRYCRA